MRVIEPQQRKAQLIRKKRKRAHLQVVIVGCLVLIVLVASGTVWISRGLALILFPDAVAIQSAGQPITLPWPATGEAALGALGYGVLATSGPQKPLPTASVAKLMVAVAVLRLYPISLGDQGQTLTLSSSDVALYNSYQVKDGSVVPVAAGETITEYQALQAMLLPSANNMADSLAIWATGSMGNYIDYANTLAASLNLHQTHFSGASGFAPDTVSTPSDLVVLAALAMQNPVIAQIVAQKSATIPVAGVVQNVNFLLGEDGIIGIKTGNTDQAGGCYLFAANHQYPSGQTITLVGTIMGAPSLYEAVSDAVPLLHASYTGFEMRTLVKQGQVVGTYNVPWGQQVRVAAERDLNALVWKGVSTSAHVNLSMLSAPQVAGQTVGSVVYGSDSTPVLLSSSIPAPSKGWSVLHFL